MWQDKCSQCEGLHHPPLVAGLDGMFGRLSWTLASAVADAGCFLLPLPPQTLWVFPLHPTADHGLYQGALLVPKTPPCTSLWPGRCVKILMPPGSSPLPATDRREGIYTPALLPLRWVTLRHESNPGSRGPQMTKQQSPASHSDDLITAPLLGAFPALSYSPTALLMFPGIPSQVSYL